MPQKFDYKPLLSRAAPAEPQFARARARYDFSVGYAEPTSVPIEGLWQGLRDCMREERGPGLALYPPAGGYEELRELVVRKLARDRGMHVTKDEIVLGHGSGQLIRDVIALLVDPGDTVISEEFFYVGTLRHMRYYGADVVGVPMDEEGMRADELARILGELSSRGKKPKLMYTIPSYQNPWGSMMSLERRRAIVDVVREHGVPVLEDDCYVDLRYEGDTPPPAMCSLDDSGQMMYVSSFSKIVGPGVRMGWVAVPREMAGRLNAIRMDGGPNQLAAMALAGYLSDDMYPHIDEVSAIIREKRDAMLSALGEHFPPTCRWTKPKGGLFLWLELPEEADTQVLHDKAFEAGVGYAPGVIFSPSGDKRNCLRLCFSYMSPEDIRQGVRILAEVFEREGALRA